jgi:elongation factor 3
MLSSSELCNDTQWIMDMIPVLTDAHKKTPIDPRLNALGKIRSMIINGTDVEFQRVESCLVQHILPIVLNRMSDKPPVVEAANQLGHAIIDNLSIQAFPHVTRIMMMNLEQCKGTTKIGALKLLGQYITRVNNLDQDLLSATLPELVPNISAHLHDAHGEVGTEAAVTITMAMKGVTNNDLSPLIEDLIGAMIDRDRTDEVIRKLSGVVFVQTMEGSALSVIVPLILAGFRTSTSAIKRVCARIVENMTKLLEDPMEGLPFFQELLPALHNAADMIPDPEARSVANQTYEALSAMMVKAHEITLLQPFRDADYITQTLKEVPDSKYVAEITASLIKTKTVEKDEYIRELSPYTSNEVVEQLYTEALKVIKVADMKDDDEDDGEKLCDCEFTLAYGTNVLLHNTTMKLIRGKKYGLLGKNDSGKTTLMKAIADGSIDGFPDSSEVKTVFVEADIQGELSHLNCVDYVLNSPNINGMGATEPMVRDMLKKVGFSEGKSSGSGGDCDDPISSLSGGWRMKLALARAMLQKADIILMDEPTNHLDVKNVKWVKSYINSLKDTTVIMVSHDSGLLDECCDYILQIDALKLKLHKGNLSAFVETHPEARSYFEFKAAKFSFSFPKPSYLDGVKSRGKVLMKMDHVSFTYPGNTVPTINDITVRASMASRVACVGVNGAGKSTMIKVLTGELEPTVGTVWKYPNSRIGYIAQHAFHHIESHLDKTPNEYIQWRYQCGNDREGLDKASMKLTEEEELALTEPVTYTWKTDNDVKKEQRIISRLTGQRRECEGRKKLYEYEVSWKNKGIDSNTWFKENELLKFNKIYAKMIRSIDQKENARGDAPTKVLTQDNIEKHLSDIGLEPEYGTHFQIAALSGGQKVKVVLAAAMWDQPHILILDEPTNYLDRDSLGALADAITRYEGGIIMITHNDAFCRQLCPERWVLENGRLNTEGDVDWMDKTAKQDVAFEKVDELAEDLVDATGNRIKIKRKKTMNAKEKKKMVARIKSKIASNEDFDSEEEEYAIEWNL